eukprot:scaffold37189_cov31-Tisochrysis_lutea.AAC.3
MSNVFGARKRDGSRLAATESRDSMYLLLTLNGAVRSVPSWMSVPPRVRNHSSRNRRLLERYCVRIPPSKRIRCRIYSALAAMLPMEMAAVSGM